ncbi:hypothetical protein CANCADRAFT_4003 [Tortispora caseinolytica NRRL Y-17796]|uniref:Multiple RNA-binding domain-containing protein 1 n=1 Tax=Tortispora caseinolytica NRRL Y-17796 TaxID=767744 RepID=A0A1E4TC82_9ASCO|nr:hypothetical protein CANCADRAFT_4003 [Tortispora caseinolytica NRRL Y-17796]
MSRIIVKNVPPRVSEDRLKEHFKQFSAITDCKLVKFRDGRTRGFGFIGYKSEEDALNAVKYFDQSFIDTSKIAVEIARSFKDPGLQSELARRSAAKHSQRRQSNDYSDPEGQNGKRKRDPKFQEYLEAMKPAKSSRTWANDDFFEPEQTEQTDHTVSVDADPSAEESDPEEFHVVSKEADKNDSDDPSEPEQFSGFEDGAEDHDNIAQDETVSDEQWLISRQKRIPETEAILTTEPPAEKDNHKDEPEPTKTSQEETAESPEEEQEDAFIEKIRSSKRLFLRNLAYSVTEEDLKNQFSKFGPLEEAHLAIDTESGASKGYAYILYEKPEDAISAYTTLDKEIFHGRLLHIIPAEPKRTNRLNEYDLKNLPLKKQRELKRQAEAAKSDFSWNSLYMSADAVVAAMAEKLSVSKADILDPESSDAAVRQALAESQIINDVRSYFEEHGIDLTAFKNSKEKSDTTILVKNFPHGTTLEEIKEMFEEYGELHRILMPPSGTVAIVEFTQAVQARAAFTKLAYRRFKTSIIYLEKAPVNIFTGKAPVLEKSQKAVSSVGVSEIFDDAQEDDTDDIGNHASLFVKNLSFKTTDSELVNAFNTLSGYLSAVIKKKPNPKNPGQLMSMGFGFVEFKTRENALKAAKVMDGFTLGGHKLQVKLAKSDLSEIGSGQQAADSQRKKSAKGTKLLIKNLPFEATKKDVRALFGAYGQIRTVRVPKKFDSSSRGFAFVEFMGTKDASHALKSLSGTHLLGRRLVISYASADAEDAEQEIERMQKKVQKQVQSEQLASMRLSGKRKFDLEENIMSKKWLDSYEKLLIENGAQIASIESTLRSLSYIIPGQFQDVATVSEGLYTTLNILGLYHNSIISKAIDALPESPYKPKPSLHTRYINATYQKDRLCRGISIFLTVIGFSEILYEMTVEKALQSNPVKNEHTASLNNKRKWQAILSLEAFKATLRLILLFRTNFSPLPTDLVIQRDNDPAELEQTFARARDPLQSAFDEIDPQHKTYRLPRSGTILPPLPVNEVNSFLMSRILTEEDILPAEYLLSSLYTQPIRSSLSWLDAVRSNIGLVGEITYIIRPVIYTALLTKYRKDPRDWRPWIAGFSLEFLAYKMLETHYEDLGGPRKMSRLESEELSNRRHNLVWWIVRSAFYRNISRQLVMKFLASIKRVPVFGSLTALLLEDFQYLIDRYYYATATL